MGNSKSSVVARRDAEVAEWTARLQRYFDRYGLKPTPQRVAALIGRIVEDRAVWFALLAKYGPEQDPPYDQPPEAASDDIGLRRRRLHMASSSTITTKEQWARRFLRYFDKYRPELTPEAVQKYVRRIPLDELPIAWEVVVRTYGPEPLGIVVDDSKSEQRSEIRSATSGTRGATAGDRAEMAEFKVKALRLLRSRGVVCTLDELDLLLGSMELIDATANVQDRAALGKSTNAPFEITRAEWARIIADMEPQRDLFEIEDLLDEYSQRPGSYDELFLTLLTMIRQPKSRNRSITDLSPTEFWVQRILRLRRQFGKPLDGDEEGNLRARVALTGFESAWKECTAVCGVESESLRRQNEHHREYWAHQVALLRQQAFPSVDLLTLMKAARSEFSNLPNLAAWRAHFTQISTDYGVDRQDAEEGLKQAQSRSLAQVNLTEKAEWKVRLTNFYNKFDAAKVDKVDELIQKASATPGGLTRMWELLLHKYGVTDESTLEDNTLVVEAPQGPLKEESSSLPPPTPVITETVAIAEPLPTSQHVPPPRDNPDLWLLRLHCMRLAAGIDVAVGVMERQFHKLRSELRSSAQAYTVLCREYQEWDPPAMNEAFWKWRVALLETDLRRENPLVFLPNVTEGMAMKDRYIQLRNRFRGDSKTGEEAFETFYRLQESRYETTHGWMKAPPSVAEVNDRNFWFKKLADYRNQYCKNVSDQSLINALDFGEVRGRSYDQVYVNFVKQSQQQIQPL